MIRRAGIPDLDALCTIEQCCFDGDRMSRRAMRYMLKNPAALFFVAEENRRLQGYILTLSHPRNRLARHYSVAILPEFRRLGLAAALLETAGQACGKPGCKLEIREDNAAAMRLYTRLGYHVTGRKADYYEDGASALAMVKMQ